MSEDYTVFAHLLGPYNPATDGPLWAQHDSQPGWGSYPTTRWAPGEIILDDYQLILGDDVPPGVYTLEAGMYRLATMERVPVLGADGQPVDDHVELRPMRVPTNCQNR